MDKEIINKNNKTINVFSKFIFKRKIKKTDTIIISVIKDINALMPLIAGEH